MDIPAAGSSNQVIANRHDKKVSPNISTQSSTVSKSLLPDNRIIDNGMIAENQKLHARENLSKAVSQRATDKVHLQKAGGEASETPVKQPVARRDNTKDAIVLQKAEAEKTKQFSEQPEADIASKPDSQTGKEAVKDAAGGKEKTALTDKGSPSSVEKPPVEPDAAKKEGAKVEGASVKDGAVGEGGKDTSAKVDDKAVKAAVVDAKDKDVKPRDPDITDEMEAEATADYTIDDILRTKKGLKSTDPAVRWRSVYEAARHGLSSLSEELIDMLEDKDMKVRTGVVTALGDIEEEDAVPKLTGLLDSDSSGLRYAAIRALVKIGDPSVGTLVSGLTEKRLANRTVIIHALQAITGKEFDMPPQWVKWYNENRSHYEPPPESGQPTAEKGSEGDSAVDARSKKDEIDERGVSEKEIAKGSVSKTEAGAGSESTGEDMLLASRKYHKYVKTIHKSHKSIDRPLEKKPAPAATEEKKFSQPTSATGVMTDNVKIKQKSERYVRKPEKSHDRFAGRKPMIYELPKDYSHVPQGQPAAAEEVDEKVVKSPVPEDKGKK